MWVVTEVTAEKIGETKRDQVLAQASPCKAKGFGHTDEGENKKAMCSRVICSKGDKKTGHQRRRETEAIVPSEGIALHRSTCLCGIMIPVAAPVALLAND